MSEQSERMLRAAMKDQYRDMHAEIERLRAGLQLIANDKNRLMNEVARQTAASILGGKPIGEVPEWPTREEAEKRAAELMAIGRATLAAAGSAEAVTWKPIIILCRTCGADVNREPHKPGCSADITASQPTVRAEK